MTATVRVGFIPLVDARCCWWRRGTRVSPSDEGLHSTSCARCPGPTSGTSSISAISTPRICWRPPRSRPASGSGMCTVDTIAPVALGLNGNAITVSRRSATPCWRRQRGRSRRPARQRAGRWPASSGERAARTAGALTFGHVFPFSAHHYQLRLWMASGGVDPDRGRATSSCCRRPTWREASRVGSSTASASARPGTASPCWPTSAASCTRDRHRATTAPKRCSAIRAEWDEAESPSTNGLVRALPAAARWCDEPSQSRTGRVAGSQRRARCPSESSGASSRAIWRLRPGSYAAIATIWLLRPGATQARSRPRRLALRPDGRGRAGCCLRCGYDRDGGVPAGPVRAAATRRRRVTSAFSVRTAQD